MSKARRSKTLTSGNLTAGKHTFTWNGKNENDQSVGAGVYFYKMQSPVETINKKMLLIR
jgi:flagellar hook assembly protein FlgD